MPETNRKGQVELEKQVFELSGFNGNERGAEMKKAFTDGRSPDLNQRTRLSFVFLYLFQIQ